MTIDQIVEYVSRRHGNMVESTRRREGDRLMVILPFRMQLEGSSEDPHHITFNTESEPSQIDALFSRVRYCGCLECRRLEFRPDLWWR
jgi:hypothetical protein